MKTRVYGKIIKKAYEIDWTVDSTYSEILKDPERYIREYEELVDYVEINEKAIQRGKPKCNIIDSYFDADKQEILHYADYQVKIIEGDQREKNKKIEYLKSVCNEHIQLRLDMEEADRLPQKKWYEFWK